MLGLLGGHGMNSGRTIFAQEDAGLDRRMCICPGGDRQEEAQPGHESLHNIADSQYLAFRENAHFAGSFESAAPIW